MLARVHRLTPAARQAVEQLAVVPSRVEPALLRALCPDLAPVAEAERLGVLEVRPDAVAFRHELARRAVVESLPVTVRLDLHERVTAALLAGPVPDLARVLHHSVEAGDDAAVVRHGPAVAREASGRGRTGRPSRPTPRCWTVRPCSIPPTMRRCSTPTPGASTTSTACTTPPQRRPPPSHSPIGRRTRL